jgi:hypothetical protein
MLGRNLIVVAVRLGGLFRQPRQVSMLCVLHEKILAGFGAASIYWRAVDKITTHHAV